MKLRLVRAGLVAAMVLAMVLGGRPVRAGTIDQAASAALTGYLRKHHLPLVGAQISTAPDGGRQVVLYGFVASEQGKADAERRTISYLKSPGITIFDRIVVKPEIRDLSARGGAAPPSASAGTMTWDQLMQHIQGNPIRLAPDSEADTPSPNSYGP